MPLQSPAIDPSSRNHSAFPPMKPWHLALAAILVVIAAALLATDYSGEQRREWVSSCAERAELEWCERHWDKMTSTPELRR